MKVSQTVFSIKLASFPAQIQSHGDNTVHFAKWQDNRVVSQTSSTEMNCFSVCVSVCSSENEKEVSQSTGAQRWENHSSSVF